MRKMCFFTGSEDLCPDDFGYSQEVQCSCDDSILQWQWLCWISRQGNLLVLNWRFIGVLSLSYLFISVPHVISPPSFSLYCWSSLDLRLYFRVHILRRLPFCLFGLNLQNWLQLKKSVSVLFNWCLVNNYYVTLESAGSRRKDYTSLKMMISDHPWICQQLCLQKLFSTDSSGLAMWKVCQLTESDAIRWMKGSKEIVAKEDHDYTG